ncbi:cadherin-related family member 5 isoform X7 [Dendrobates tinctorius]|uniref:cadherin-related family member 5 isoform X7 n=1 Tax=Dendrobates tinctorius TaxID=92724 RepID=UPI003CC9C556
MGPLLALCFLIVFPMGCYSQACRSANPLPSIREDAKPGTVVTALITEPEHTAEVEVRQFRVNGSNLVLFEEVDYETEAIISVTLICRKGSQIVLGETFFVQIINVNDNSPIFKEASYSFQILESLQVSSTFGSPIQAEDADGDTLYYELIAEDKDTADYFRLSSVTYPLLAVNKPLDYDLHPHVRLNLTARDTEFPGDNPSFTATTSIIIDIIDADDKPPFFQPCRIIGKKVCISDGYTTSVNRSEAITQPLELIPGPLYAIDGDYGINDPISYTIISGNGNNIFDIGVANGNITMNKPVDTLGTILLQIMAYQTNDELKYSTTTVQIEVKEKNYFPPRFQKSNYAGTIPSNMEIRSFVRDSSDQTKQLHVFAVDEDFPDGLNLAVTYKIENSNDFMILRDGYILTNTVFASPGTAVFVVNATDSTSSESTTTTVTIEITNALPTTTTTGTNTRTTASTTPGTGTTTTTTPNTRTTTSTTPGTGTTTTTTPNTRTTTSTTPGTGTTTTTTPSTGTTTSTTPGTGTTTTPNTRTTTSTTPGTGTTTTTMPNTRTTTSTTPGTGTTTTTTPSTGTTKSTSPGTGTTTTTTPSTRTTTSITPGTGGNDGEKQDKYYTATDMAILGATLGVVLAACVVGLAFLIYKHHGNTIRSKLRRGTGNNSGGYADRQEQLINEEEYGGSISSSGPEFGIDSGITEVPSGNNLPSVAAVSTVLTTSAPTESPPLEEADGESDSEDKKVKSILTKDLKEDGGYKSVWFREDAAPEVMVIEGVENGEANDDYTEDEFNNQQEDDEDDEDELNPTFSTPNNDSNNLSIL